MAIIVVISIKIMKEHNDYSGRYVYYESCYSSSSLVTLWWLRPLLRRTLTVSLILSRILVSWLPPTTCHSMSMPAMADSCCLGESLYSPHATQYHATINQLHIWIERLEKLGCNIPKFDFRCRGVTSMSADLHKFGYTPKVRPINITISISRSFVLGTEPIWEAFLLQGASAVVYANEELRKYQLFSVTTWNGGLFGSTTMAGTRSGESTPQSKA